MKEIITNLMFSIMHAISYFKLPFLIVRHKKIHFSENPIKSHLEFDYMHHGNKEPLNLYNKGKIRQAIDENINAIKRYL